MPGSAPSTDEARTKNPLRYEVLGVLFCALGLLSLFSLYSPAAGAVGGILAKALDAALGGAAFLFPLLSCAYGVSLLVVKEDTLFTRQGVGAALLALAAVALLHLRVPLGGEFVYGLRGLGGGLIGGALSWLLVKGFGPVGRLLLLITMALLGAILAAGPGLAKVAARLRLWSVDFGRGLVAELREFLFLAEEEGEKLDAGRRRTRGRAGEGAGPSGTAEAAEAEAIQPEGPAKGEEEAAAGWNAVQTTGAGATTPSRGGGASASAGSASALTLSASPPPRSEVVDDFPEGAFEQVHIPLPLHYQLPSLSILDRGSQRVRRDQREQTDKAKVIEDTLESFGVKAKVIGTSRGPAITRFELQPAPGVKVRQIASLEDDLALALAAHYVRIQAPIPGKAAVGIEVPNREVAKVLLREVLEADDFRAAASRLTIVLGKDIAGRAIVGNLERMVHLLIAGTTGSGKSVCINTIVSSLLFKSRPDEVKFLMIDPKVVELSIFSGIPHLLSPVVTDPKKAATALRWVVREMERRYELFALAGSSIRDIDRYNQLVEDKGDGTQPKLPFIVVIIDELADLMVVAPAEVEESIFRLAQMARAAGIHLIVATQRPSVDVITGVIKANIPSRIAFAVSSQVDSRTILDEGGAEKLLGRGDMLYLPVGQGRAIRAQGALISDREVEALVAFVKSQAEPQFEEGVLTVQAETGTEPTFEDDPLFKDAVRLVVESGVASISMIQRRFRVGYSRAARLIDVMELRGVVGRFGGSKPREVLITPDQMRRIFDGER
ncbi:MAG TPA: DNA translocase FtsK [Bacillota bacterium]